MSDDLDKLDAALASQIGDDVAVIFNHESLFKRSREAIAALRSRVEAAEAALTAERAKVAALVEALRVADVEIMESIRAFEGVASDIRAAIEAARGE